MKVSAEPQKRSSQLTSRSNRQPINQNASFLRDAPQPLLDDLSTGAILNLQRLIGNHAVIQRLKQHRNSTVTGSLPPDLQLSMESTLGADFSNVHIHTDSPDPQIYGADAYTAGEDIHFAPQAFNTYTQDGQHLIAHELAHVVQQRSDRVHPTGTVHHEPVNDDESLENEADAFADGAIAHAPAEGSTAGIQPKRRVLQFGRKTERHHENWRKHTKRLIASKKRLGLNKSEKAMYSAAKELAGILDEPKGTKLKYRPYHSGKTGGISKTKRMLAQTRGLYKLMEKMGIKKEEFQYFEYLNFSGRKMKATLIPGRASLMVGSNTGDTYEGYFFETARLNHRKRTGGSALYIAGHLLNDHLGGSGRIYNLVPLTAEKKSPPNKTGSNDANGIHEKQVESRIKGLAEMPATVKSITYKVKSLDPARRGGPRQQTAIVKKFASLFDYFANLHPSETVKQIRARVISADTDYQGNSIAKDLITATGKGPMTSLSVMAAALDANAKLWELEDSSVPYGISCTASYTDMGDVVHDVIAKDGRPINNYVIVNILPNLYTAPYKE